MSIQQFCQPNEHDAFVHKNQKILWYSGDIFAINNTTSPFSLQPVTANSIGSQAIPDSLLFNKPNYIVSLSGSGVFSVNSGVTTTFSSQMIIDGTTYVFFSSGFTGSSTLTNARSIVNVYFKPVNVTSTNFDLVIFGQTLSNTSLNSSVIGNCAMRPIFLFADNSGNHFPRGATYTFGNYYQFSVADNNNSATILNASISLLNV